MGHLRWLFSRTDGAPSAWDVILWWEKRRLPYNIIVCATGTVSYTLFLVFITRSGVLRPGEDAVEPLAMIIAPLVWNVCYTGGWMAELVLRPLFRRSPKLGPTVLIAGLVLSHVVIFLPSTFWGGYLVWKTLKHIIL